MGLLFVLLIVEHVLCGCPAALEPGDHTIELMVDGLSRTADLHIPPGAGAELLPLVLNFHGLTSQPSDMVWLTGMSTMADKENFIVVYPRGTGTPGVDSSWHTDDYCCGYALANDIDDLAFINALLDHLEGELCIHQTFATGFSNGAIMSHHLACHMGDRLTAVSPLEGHFAYIVAGCSTTNWPSMLYTHGTADSVVPYDGYGYGDAHESTVNYATSKLGCDATETVSHTQGPTTCYTYGGCGEANATFCRIEGMDHEWPHPVRNPGWGLDLSGQTWAFFKRFVDTPTTTDTATGTGATSDPSGTSDASSTTSSTASTSTATSDSSTSATGSTSSTTNSPSTTGSSSTSAGGTGSPSSTSGGTTTTSSTTEGTVATGASSRTGGATLAVLTAVVLAAVL